MMTRPDTCALSTWPGSVGEVGRQKAGREMQGRDQGKEGKRGTERKREKREEGKVGGGGGGEEKQGTDRGVREESQSCSLCTLVMEHIQVS